LAYEVVARYHGVEVADEELLWWKNTFSNKQVPADIPDVFVQKSIKAFDLVRTCLSTEPSNSDIRRLFTQGAVQLSEEKIDDFETIIKIERNAILKIGKRKWYRVIAK